MYGDWLYYLMGCVLLAANVVAWVGTLYRLPGNWVIVANCALYVAFFPEKDSGLGFGWFTVGLTIALASVGEAVAFAIKRHRQSKHAPSERPVAGILTGAGVGSLLGSLLGFSVPIIGWMVAIIGSITGAAGGAYLGTLMSYRRHSSLQTIPATTWTSRLAIEATWIIPKLTVGALILLIVTVGTFMG